MPDDILDAAQKATDNATTVVDTGVAPLPPEPAPEPMVPSAPPAAPEDATKLVESILETKNPEPVVAPPAPSQPPKPVKTKRAPVAVIALLLLVFGALVGGGAYFVSKRTEIADTRGKAAGRCEQKSSTGSCNTIECVEFGNSQSTCTSTTNSKCCQWVSIPLGTPVPPTSAPLPTASDYDCKSPQYPCPRPGQPSNWTECERVGLKWRCVLGGAVHNTPAPTIPLPTRTPIPPTGTSCRNASLISDNPNSTSVTITRAMVDECNNACPGTNAKLWVATYRCDAITSSGCSDNPQVKTWNASFGSTHSVPAPTCGTIQIDVGCKNSQRSLGTVAWAGKAATRPCGSGNTPNPPQPSRTPTQPANPVCLDIRIFKGGSQVTDLTSLRPNDAVVFYVRGSLAAATKARFRVNGATWTETTTKNEAGGWFILNYTIPEGVAQFVIEGEVFMGGAWH